MAGRTFLRSGLVEQYILAIDLSYRLVAAFAFDVAMLPLQRKIGFPIMIEDCGLPLCAVVAEGTASDAFRGKLFSMNVLVAVFAGSGSCLEVHVHQRRLQVRRPMAVHASGGLVSSDQRKRGFRMVEAR